MAVAAPAQEPRGDSIRIRTRSPERTFTYRVGPESHMVMRRGRLGITVDLRPEAARDTLGALVSGVTPGAPAERAGVRAGDLITRLNGTRLAAGDTRGGDADAGRSRPGLRLIEIAARLEHGDTVRLDVLRDSRPLTVTFTAAETDMDVLVERLRSPGGAQRWLREFGGPGMPEGMPRLRIMTDAHGLGDLELIRVSPELAQALGISEGVLVADAGGDSALGLRTGDVITSIGGRRPTGPAQAMRILSSYEAGESVQFDVARRGRRIQVNGRLPQERPGPWRIQPNNFESFDDFGFHLLPRMRQELHRMAPHFRRLSPVEPMRRMIDRKYRGEGRV